MNDKIKVRDDSKVKIIKTLYNNMLTDIYSQLNKSEIVETFTAYLTEEESKQFKKYVESLSDELFDKIYLRIKKYNKSILKHITKFIIEERIIKHNEIKIDEVEKNEKLQISIIEKTPELKELVKKV
jgi:hypothetical protein